MWMPPGRGAHGLEQAQPLVNSMRLVARRRQPCLGGKGRTKLGQNVAALP